MKIQRDGQVHEAEPSVERIGQTAPNLEMQQSDELFDTGVVFCLSTLAIFTGAATIGTAVVASKETFLNAVFQRYEISGEFLKSIVLGGVTVALASNAIRVGRRNRD